MTCRDGFGPSFTTRGYVSSTMGGPGRTQLVDEERHVGDLFDHPFTIVALLSCSLQHVQIV